MNELAGKLDPAFVVIGGDLAYAHSGTNKVEKMERWDAYFDSWKQKARTPDGRLVPTDRHHRQPRGPSSLKARRSRPRLLCPLPDARPARLQRPRLRQLPEPVPARLRPHPSSRGRADARGSKRTLSERQRVPHLFPVYHVPAWPSYRPEETAAGARRFATNGVRSLKYRRPRGFRAPRSHFQADGPHPRRQAGPAGITYLGDGAWGVKLRNPDRKPRWYIAKAAISAIFTWSRFTRKPAMSSPLTRTGRSSTKSISRPTDLTFATRHPALRAGVNGVIVRHATRGGIRFKSP